MEEILDPGNNRLNPYPIQHPDLWKFLHKQRSCIWFTEEVDLSKDDFDTLTDNEKTFVKMILAFFSQFDGIVNLNIADCLMNEIQIIEAKYNYRWQMAIEDIHADMYALLIETYITDDEEKEKIRNGVNTFPILNEIKTWGEKWIRAHDASFSTKLLVNIIMEGIFFSGPFCLIFYLSNNNKLQGLVKSNEFIARDEGMHTEFGILLFNKLQHRPQEKIVHKIFREAIEIKSRFVHQSLPCRMTGMSSEKMVEYIKFLSDRILEKMGYKSLFDAKKNPFPFMDRIGLEGKNNFFESRTTEYQKAKCHKRLNLSELHDF